MRQLFADGWNSFWHFTFGALSTSFVWIIPIFVLYQLIDPYEPNVPIDLSEFAIGYGVVYLAWTARNQSRRKTPP